MSYYIIIKGAGDAFVGSFAHYLNLLGKDSIEKSIELASDYATLTVQKPGTQSSYPKLEELEEKFNL
jgi:ribokinase